MEAVCSAGEPVNHSGRRTIKKVGPTSKLDHPIEYMVINHHFR